MIGREVVCSVVSATVSKNASGDDQINVFLVAGSGERLVDKLPVTERGAPLINNLLDALGISRFNFWSDGIVVDGGEIVSVGPRDVAGVRVRAVVRAGARVRYTPA